ncbi:MAG: hypothetical protein WAQ08_04240 [Aquabacterium sp.]|jgi:hypothetical protein|uniref:hypothetical protein n=1 Tax=Aquabacterium sp. TaxID=1872578 RepID=UPI003BB03C3C
MTIKYLTSFSLVALACLATSAIAQPASQPADSAAAPEAAASTRATPASSASQPTRAYINQAGDAVIAPLGDLNLMRAKIPDALKEALVSPYAEPPARECAALTERIQALDAALGADLDAPKTGNEASLLDQAGKASINMISDTTTGIVPFRGWVRRLTGAERHSKRVAAAITAGSLRRAYLKGYARAQGCPATAPAVAAPAAKAASAASAASAP